MSVQIYKTLSELKTGENGIIEGLDLTCDSALRLQEMGIIPGESIRIIRRAPLGDPVEVKIKHYNLSLRESEAQLIRIRPE